MNRIGSFLLAVALLTSISCTGAPLIIPTAPVGPDEKVLGEARGSSTGVIVLGFIPAGQNGRFQSAYDHALSKWAGSTRLVDLTIQERWWWGYVVYGFNFRVKGTAVGPK